MMMKMMQTFLVLSLAGLTLAASAATEPQIKGLTRRAKGVRGASRKAEEAANHRILKKDDDSEGGVDIAEIIGFGCFSEVATAEVEHRGPVTMKDLRVGDKVLTASNDYQPVYAFGHRNPDKTAEFRQVHTSESVMELTAEHLVFLKDQIHPVRADSLQVGDALLGKEGSEQRITKIETIQRQGLYTPFTPDGTVVVDGIAASSYISLQEGKSYLALQNGVQLPLSQHDYIHMGLSPMRLLCMGVSSSYCRHHYNDEGLPPYVAWSIDMSTWTTQHSTVVQFLILTAFLLVFVPILATETLFGPSLAPLAIFCLASLLVWRNRNVAKKQKSL